jgi:hypothetical protein
METSYLQTKQKAGKSGELLYKVIERVRVEEEVKEKDGVCGVRVCACVFEIACV